MSVSATGHVDAFLVSPEGGIRKIMEGENTLLYRCSDAVARIFAGVVSRIPTTIGFVWSGSDAHMTSFHFTPGVRDNMTESEIVGDSLHVHDVPIDQIRRFATTDKEKYEGNKVTLSAQTIENSDDEYIYGFLLKGADGSVLAVKKIGDSPVKRNSGFAMAASWSVTFN